MCNISDACQHLQKIWDVLDDVHTTIIKGKIQISINHNHYDNHGGVIQEDIYELILSFLDIFDDLIKSNILDNFRNGQRFSDDLKLGLNCWCVSVNIIGLYFDAQIHVVLSNISLPKRLHQYIKDLHEYLHINAIAKRMIEVSLYCLCNYYNMADRKSGLLEETNESIMKDIFLKGYDGVKLASGIILSFQNEYCNHVEKEYVQGIYNSNIDESNPEFLGIQGYLMQKAIVNRTCDSGCIMEDIDLM